MGDRIVMISFEQAKKKTQNDVSNFQEFDLCFEYENAFVFYSGSDCEDEEPVIGGYTSPFIVWKKDGSIDFGFAAAMFDDTLGNELKKTKLNH